MTIYRGQKIGQFEHDNKFVYLCWRVSDNVMDKLNLEIERWCGGGGKPHQNEEIGNVEQLKSFSLWLGWLVGWLMLYRPILSHLMLNQNFKKIEQKVKNNLNKLIYLTKFKFLKDHL